MLCGDGGDEQAMSEWIALPKNPCPINCPKRSATCHSTGSCKMWDDYQIDYAKYRRAREINIARMQAIFEYERSVGKRRGYLTRKRLSRK